jgi:hypothetical protein
MWTSPCHPDLLPRGRLADGGTFDTLPGTSRFMYVFCATSVMAAHCCDVGQATVDKLPDDALLDIFAVYLNDDDQDRFQSVDKWHTLVHVCRRWRGLVFASPCSLNLRLLCRRHRRVAGDAGYMASLAHRD